MTFASVYYSASTCFFFFFYNDISRFLPIPLVAHDVLYSKFLEFLEFEKTTSPPGPRICRCDKQIIRRRSSKSSNFFFNPEIGSTMKCSLCPQRILSLTLCDFLFSNLKLPASYIRLSPRSSSSRFPFDIFLAYGRCPSCPFSGHPLLPSYRCPYSDLVSSTLFTHTPLF